MKKIQIYDERGRREIIVVGGGVAGAAAALQAARLGRKTLLIEKTITLGGLATQGLINYFVPMCNGRGKQIIRGLCEEMLRMAIRDGYDTLPEEWKNGEPKEKTEKRYVTRFSPMIFALTLAEALRGAGVEMLLDTTVTDVDIENGHVKGLMVENKGGRAYYEADFVIDCTGDADVLSRAGVPTVIGKNYFSYVAQATDLEHCKKAVETRDIAHVQYMLMGGNANLYGGNHPADRPLYTGVTAEDITEYVLDNQEVLLEKLRRSPRNERDIAMLPGMPQYREIRCIDGDYTLREEDKYKHFGDYIAAISDFDRRDALYEVPLRCLTRKGFDNLLCAGRVAAATGYAWDVLRVIPPAIITGQAAAVVTDDCFKKNRGVDCADVAAIQKRLEALDVTVHFDDSLVPSEPKEQVTNSDSL